MITLGHFVWRGHELAYEELAPEGEVAPARVIVLIHGLLLDSGVNRALGRELAREGNRVILLELLGHGRSDKPHSASLNRIDVYADQVVGLLDHLGLREAVIGGVSLGACVALMAAARHPDRVRGLFLEMPVLENAAPFAALFFVPLLVGLNVSGPLGRAATALLRALPDTGIEAVDSFKHALSARPQEIMSVLHGTLIGPLAPTVEERRNILAPALVVGHDVDVLHPFTDARRLTNQLPNARMIRARDLFELRTRPERLTGEITAFVASVWAARPVREDGRTGT